MRFALLFLSLLCFTSVSFGQENSIQKEILEYKESQSALISKGRRLLIDSFLAGDLAKVKSVKDYLITEVQNDNYLALYPMEHWLIAYWTQDYKEVLASVEQLDTLGYEQLMRKVRPQQDMMLQKLRDVSYDSLEHLKNDLAVADLRAIDKEFLQLHLTYILTKPELLEGQQETINRQANDFLEGYPYSAYENFIRSNIRYQLVPSKWAFTFEFFSGYATMTDALNLHFSNAVPIGIAFDVYYNKWAFSLRNYIGISGVNKDIQTGNTTWSKGSNTSIFIPELAVGYVLADSRKFKFSPFAGIASTDISPTQVDINKNPDLKGTGLTFTTTYSLGAMLDVKLGKSKVAMVKKDSEQNYWFLRFRYAFQQPQFSRHYPGFTGNIHNFTIGLGGFGRALNREY